MSEIEISCTLLQQGLQKNPEISQNQGNRIHNSTYRRRESQREEDCNLYHNHDGDDLAPATLCLQTGRKHTSTTSLLQAPDCGSGECLPYGRGAVASRTISVLNFSRKGPPLTTENSMKIACPYPLPKFEKKKKDTSRCVARTHRPLKNNPKNPRKRDPRRRGQGPTSLHGEPCTRLDFDAAEPLILAGI